MNISLRLMPIKRRIFIIKGQSHGTRTESYTIITMLRTIKAICTEEKDTFRCIQISRSLTVISSRCPYIRTRKSAIMTIAHSTNNAHTVIKIS